MAELYYPSNLTDNFEYMITSSDQAFTHITSLSSTLNSDDIKDMQALASATRAKNAVSNILKEISNANPF